METDPTVQGGFAMRFVVKRYWSLCDEVEVDAQSTDGAIRLAHELPINNVTAEFVPDSLESDPETDVQSLQTNKRLGQSNAGRPVQPPSGLGDEPSIA